YAGRTVAAPQSSGRPAWPDPGPAGGGENGAAVNVEWQVRRNLTVSSKFGGQGEASLSIRWRRQSREPGAGREDRRPNR
ncbi:MAG TPA: hypothetical protein PLR59_08775, partial [Brevundimonas sp.]|nr:hypothetical protein [Brevundimonas sp.]